MYRLLRPLLFALPAETAHRLTLALLRLCPPALLTPFGGRPAPALRQRLCGLTFPGPVGLAAGLDKDAELVPSFRALGFGAVEIGSVTARSASGNPRPRVFRLREDEALINRMGLPNHGAERVAERLAGLRQGADPDSAPLGVNLAKTHDPAILGADAVADFCESYRRLAPLADYVVLNVSCPNTADGRTFEEPAALADLLAALARQPVPAPPPLFLKLAPPPPDALDETNTLRPESACAARLADLLQIARAANVAGLVLGNTAPDRHGLRRDASAYGRGGLSGPPLQHRSLAMVRHCFRATRAAGWSPVLIGVGGVDSAESAYQRLCAGASLVQVYTALVYHGPALLRRIYQGLERALERDRHPDITAAIGSRA